MSHTRKLLLILVGAASVAAAFSAFAEDTPARVRGTLQKMDGNNLTMATKSGKEATQGQRARYRGHQGRDVGHKEQHVRRHHRHAAT
jgi:hypothetical protein